MPEKTYTPNHLNTAFKQQVRGNSASTGISIDTTVKLSAGKEQRGRVDYGHVPIDTEIDREGKNTKKKNQALTFLYKRN